MIQDVASQITDIPRWYTALAEWSACVVYVLLARRGLDRRAVAVLAVGLPSLIGIHEVAGRLRIELWTVGMAVAALAMFTVIHLATRSTLSTATYFTARAFVLAELVASFQWQLRSYWVGVRGAPEPALDLALLLLVFGVAFAGAWAIERNHFPRDQALGIEPRHALGATAIAIVTFLMSNISFVTKTSPFSGTLEQEIFYIRTLVDLAGYVALYAQQGERMELRRAVEVESMDRLLQSQHERYLQTRRSMDVVNAKYHDLKHYIAAFRAEADPKQKEAYLDQLEESIQDYGNRIDSGNPVLDAVLTSRAQRCASENITMTCVADGAAVSFIDAMSLSALVGNALDNAIEAVQLISDADRRLIRIAIYRQDGFAMLRFENYFEGPRVFDGALPRTTKSDRTQHGFGVRNMQQVATTYSGTLTVEAVNGWYVVRALIPAPAA